MRNRPKLVGPARQARFKVVPSRREGRIYGNRHPSSASVIRCSTSIPSPGPDGVGGLLCAAAHAGTELSHGCRDCGRCSRPRQSDRNGKMRRLEITFAPRARSLRFCTSLSAPGSSQPRPSTRSNYAQRDRAFAKCAIFRLIAWVSLAPQPVWNTSSSSLARNPSVTDPLDRRSFNSPDLC